MKSHKRSEEIVSFQATGDVRFPYKASVKGERWIIRINEFPESPSLYTLIVNDAEVEELIEWPNAWNRPDQKNTIDLSEKFEYEKELEHFNRTRKISPSDSVH